MGNMSVPALFQKPVNMTVFDLLQGAYFWLLLKECKKEIDVGFVGLDGVFGKTFLRDYIMEKKFFCRNELLREGCGVDGSVWEKRKSKCPLQKNCGRHFRKFSTLFSTSSDAVELAKLAASLSLFAALFDTGFFILLATLQLSFDSINLQFLFQLTDGVFKISTNFNFYHLGLR